MLNVPEYNLNFVKHSSIAGIPVGAILTSVHKGNKTYTHQKKSLAILQPVEKRGTSSYWNGHNVAYTACIHFKFGTMNNPYMPNSKPMKIGKA